jgi:hypothetical protein
MEKEPNLRLRETCFHAFSVVDLFTKKVGMIGIVYLNGWKSTINDPVLPQRPAL